MTYVTQRQLYSYDPSDPSRLVPDIAASAAKVSPHAQTITIQLKPDIRFSPRAAAP